MDVKQLESYIPVVLDTYDIPGLSVGIIQDGKPLLTCGYGVKDLQSKERVDEDTRFCIGSCTKAFTSTLLAALMTTSDRYKYTKEAAFLVRIFHVFLWRSSKLELRFTRKAG